MALVTITEAARLVRRSRRSLYRDIDSGRLSKTVSPLGTTAIDTSELLRVYGQLHGSGKSDDADTGTPGNSPVEDFEELVETWEPPRKEPPKSTTVSDDKVKLRMLEEKVKALQHVLEVEATLRKVKDEVTNELRARLEEKDRVIKILEDRMLLLGYDSPENKSPYSKRKGLLARLFGHH